MKHIAFSALALTVMLGACTGFKKHQGNCCQGNETTSVWTADEVAKNGGTMVDSTLVVEGEVVKVCCCSGKKLTLRSENGETLEVMAGEVIGTFPKDLKGQSIRATGVLGVRHISREDIEKALCAQPASAAPEDGGPAEPQGEKKACGMKDGKRCKDMQTKIERMQQYLDETGEATYPFYYIVAEKYEVKER